MAGFTSGSQSVVRFVAPVPSRIDRDAFAMAVARRRFRDIDVDLATGATSWGWVPIHDPLAETLGVADLFVQQWLVVGFRYDRRAVPAKLVWIERRRLEERRKAELGRDKLGLAARREIKTEVEERLMLRALPTPRLFDCAWNLDTGRVYFTGKLQAAREAFAECFRETFGVGPIPMIPYLTAEHLGLPTRTVEAVRAVDPALLVPPERPGRASDVPRVPFETQMEEAPR